MTSTDADPVIFPCSVRHVEDGVGVALRSSPFGGEWLVEWDDGSRTWEPREDLQVLQ